MRADEIKALLVDSRTVAKNAFRIAREICRLACSEDDEISATGREMLLRAMEYYDAFGESAAVLDAALREAGLFPFLDPARLDLADHIAYECHRPENLDRVFHGPQARIYHLLMSGKSVVLSAPTSFGKSLIVDAIVASGRFKNIVIVVPTIALIDETRRRLSRFRDRYKVVTHAFQEQGDRNIFVMTQERVLDSLDVETIDFFVIDEFYKLSPTAADQERAALLNQALYRLSKKCKHFYMLGPGIEGVSEDFRRRIQCEWVHEPFQTVVSEIHSVATPGEDPLQGLAKLCRTLQGPTIIFCSSPERTAKAAEAIRPSGCTPPASIRDAIDWIAANYHSDWHFVEALRHGIGIHHARIPRALAQHVVRAFNDEELPFLVCTSTLIEGVNTKAKNIVILDHKINRKNIDLFTFNNIRGRSGRMFEHFVGHVYVFHEPPSGELPVVDVPAFSQGDGASDALLLQLDPEDLSDNAAKRLSKFASESLLRMATLRANSGIDPSKQLALARTLLEDDVGNARVLAWHGYPTWSQLERTCELIWTHFDGPKLAANSVRNHRQLTAMIMRLSKRETVRQLIDAQLQYVNNDADAAVRTVLDLVRLWATFHFPRLLRALNRITQDVFGRQGLPVGNYDLYASKVEHLFLEPALIALEEYGVPLPLAREMYSALGNEPDFDRLLDRLRSLNVDALGLAGFARDVLLDAKTFA